jgi:hypothetical protein
LKTILPTLKKHVLRQHLMVDIKPKFLPVHTKAVHIFCVKSNLRTTLYIVFVIRIHYFVIIKTHPLCNPNHNTIMRFTSGGISQVNGGVRSRAWLRSVSVVSI